MNTFKLTCTALVAFALASSTANAAWTVINLQPAGATSSVANGIRNGQKVGQVDNQTAIWNGANTLSTVGSGSLYATDGVEQVGVSGSQATPTAWYGTPGSAIDLTPNPQIPGEISATPLGVFAGFQVGYVTIFTGSNIAGHAILWSDSGSGYIDMNPAGDPNGSSTAAGEYVGQEVGDYANSNTGYSRHAVIWNGANPNTIIDLNPQGATDSRGLAVYNGRQAGYASFAGAEHAGTWTNLANTWNDLNPAGADSSEAVALDDGQGLNREAGFAVFSGVDHAAYWAGTAGSFVDLQTYLPAGFTSSSATGIWVNPLGDTYITGYAVDANGFSEAMLWVQPVPEPASASLLLLSLPMLARRRR